MDANTIRWRGDCFGELANRLDPAIFDDNGSIFERRAGNGMHRGMIKLIPLVAAAFDLRITQFSAMSLRWLKLGDRFAIWTLEINLTFHESHDAASITIQGMPIENGYIAILADFDAAQAI